MCSKKKGRGHAWIIGVILILIWGMAILLPSAFASEDARLFLSAVTDYNEGNYQQAADAFVSLVQKGIQNGKLFYNLGNAYFKLNDIGRAILWYEKALQWIPNDPDLRFNYEYAMSFVKERADTAKNPLLMILLFWKPLLGTRLIRWLAIGCSVLFWLVLMIQTVRHANKMIWVAWLFFIPSMVFGITAVYDYYHVYSDPYAIVLSPELPIRSGLSEDANVLFVLHAGTKVKVEREKGDYYRIYFSEGQIGWVQKQGIGII
ncbi:MAG: tetratricopeptide repeat protein [Desulfobacterales bacterium]|nr:tetratricopeptide repeat protein [Desulfobacterales bacterium]